MENGAEVLQKFNRRLPDAEITLRHVCYITNDTAHVNAAEVTFLKSVGAKVELPRNSLEFLELLRESECDCIHLSLIGDFDLRRGQPEIHVQNGSSVVPHDLDDKRIQERLRKTKPFIFLNVSQTGQPDPTLVRIEKWGKKFTRAGAGVFAGFAWKFEEVLASEFAINFYQSAIDGLTIGQAIKAAQYKIGRSDRRDWSAYYQFGDPNCRIRPCSNS